MENNLKLFVWEGVLVDWSSGIAFAVAPDVETARKLIFEKSGNMDYVLEELSSDPLIIEQEAAFLIWGGS